MYDIIFELWRRARVGADERIGVFKNEETANIIRDIVEITYDPDGSVFEVSPIKMWRHVDASLYDAIKNALA